MSYVDLNTIHNPATGTVPPAAWGDQVRDNDEFLIDPPGCSVSNSSAQSVANNTVTAMTANTESFDNDAMHSTVTNTSRITAQTAGRYLLITTLEFAANGTGVRGIEFYKNGAGTGKGLGAAGTAAGAITLTAVASIVLAASDYVEATSFQTSGGNLNVTLKEFVALFLTR